MTIVLVAGPIFDVMFNFGDSDLPPYKPDPPFERVCNDAYAFVALPLPIVAFICARFGMVDPPEIILYPLLITPGLFWASMVELLFMAKRRLRANKLVGKIISS